MIAPKMLLAFAFITAFEAPVHAEELQNDSIRETISGRRVVLSAMGFEFPLFYNTSGSVTGDGTDAGLASYFTPRETGQWWVADNRLCQKFPTWYKGRTWCFQLEKVGASQLNWRRDDGFTGKARVTG